MLVITGLTILLTAVVACLPISINPAPNIIDPTNLIMRIRNSITGVDRAKILAEGGPKSFVFDFANPPNNTIVRFSRGMSIQAKEKTFPTLTGVSLTVGIIILDPCSMQQPHTHPRGGEFVMVIEGGITTQYRAENGADFVVNQLPIFSSTFFPKGSVHSSFNPSCNRAIFITAFDTNDSGFVDSGPNFFAFDDKLVQAALGGETVLSEDELATIRANKKGFIVSDQECLKNCGIKTK